MPRYGKRVDIHSLLDTLEVWRSIASLSPFPIVPVFGGDGEGGDGAGGGAGNGEGGDPPPSGNGDGGGDGSDDDSTIPVPEGASAEAKTAIEKANAEAARRRIEARDAKTKLAAAEAKLKEKTDAELTELEREKQKALDTEKVNAELQESLKSARLENVVIKVAAELEFKDSGDALLNLDASKVRFDDETGLPNETDVRNLLKTVIEKKSYLKGTPDPGSGDGAAGKGSPPPKPEDFEGQVDEHHKKFIERGRIPIPTQ